MSVPFGSGPTWETLLRICPVNQRFISPSSDNSNIRSRGALHRISSLCSAETIGISLPLLASFHTCQL